MLGIDGLITLTVIQSFLNIRRQRHGAQPIQNLLENPLIDEAQGPSAHIRFIFDDCTQLIPEYDNRTGLQLLAGFHQRFPAVFPQILQEQNLRFGAGVFLNTKQSGGNNSCIIQHERIARLKLL
ncbi:hypothetical protein D3C73_1119270 [compost metagenome]